MTDYAMTVLSGVHPLPLTREIISIAPTAKSMELMNYDELYDHLIELETRGSTLI